MELFRDTHFDFMKYRRFWIVVSFLLVGLSRDDVPTVEPAAS